MTQPKTQLPEAIKTAREFIDESHWDSSELDIVDALEALIEHAKTQKKDYVDGYLDGKAGTPKRYKGEIFRRETMIDPKKFSGIGGGKKLGKGEPIKLIQDYK